jgi:probable HAF family extracellular repeat protein
MKRRAFGVTAILVVFVLTAAVPTPAAAQSPKKLTIVELKVVADVRLCPEAIPGLGFASFINNRGDVAGEWLCDFETSRAALWRDGVMTDLFPGVRAISGPSGLNDRGQVIGHRAFDLSFNTFQAFFWERGVRTVLTLGGPDADGRALAINERGQVVGTSTLGPPPSPFHAYLFQDGAIKDLGTLPGDLQSIARDINDRGQIVGVSELPGAITVRAVLWQDGAIVDLGTGDGSEAIAINNRGQIIGTSTTADGSQRAFLWQDGVMTNLGTLGGNEIVPLKINKRGQVVGFSTNAAGNRRAFLWEDGIMRDLGTLGGNVSIAHDINNHGQVIGQSTTVAGDGRPFLWQDGVMTDLSPETPFTDAFAADINDRGEIAGTVDFRPVVWTKRNDDPNDRHEGKRHHRDPTVLRSNRPL